MPIGRFGSIAARFALAAALLCRAPNATAETHADPATLLRNGALAAKSISYVGQIETVRYSSKKAAATLARVQHRAPTLTRRSFLAPPALYGDYVIVDGAQTYYFDVKHSRLTVERDAPVDETAPAGADLNRILANYRPMAGGSAVVAGRPASIVLLVNKYTGERTMRLWLDKETNLVLQREEYRGNGAVTMTSRFDEVRYTAGFPDALFDTRPPHGFATVGGVQVASLDKNLSEQVRQAGFKPFTPKDLPQGFELLGAQTNVVRGVKTLHLNYSDGLRTLSLFENAGGAAVDFGAAHPQKVSFEDHVGDFIEEGSTTLLAWREQGLNFTLVGDLAQNELLAIAKSVVP